MQIQADLITHSIVAQSLPLLLTVEEEEVRDT